MILWLHIRRGLCVCISLYATPALADVLEVDGDQATWIAGNPSTVAPSFAATPAMRFAGMVPLPYRAKVGELALRYDLSPALIEALVWQESRWRSDARSNAGALGLTQLMPGTAREMGIDPTDPFANLEGGARYLRIQLDRFDNNLERALAAYNAGPNRVIRDGGVPRIRETRNYIAGIMARLASHSLAATSPVAANRRSN